MEKRSGEGRKEKKIGRWVPWMEKKEREKSSGIGLRREISFGGIEAEEEEEKKDGKEAMKKRGGVEVQVGKESWTRNGTV